MIPFDAAGSHILGRYRIVRELARGGMGVVYLGRVEGAAGFAKPVVIKRIIPDPSEPEETAARFVREAQILSNLQHPGIVGVLDFGEEQHGHAMVLEYVHGYDLGRWLKCLQLDNRTMSWQDAVLVLLRVLEALSYAHEFRRSDGTPAAVLHRDISPPNVLIDLDGHVRLLDFGIARMGEAEAGVYKTQTGILKGKLPYLAPELFSGAPPSVASDLYACGVVLYQMLMGTQRFLADNEGKAGWRLLLEGPRALDTVRSDLPAGLASVILGALAREPKERPDSAAELARQLRRALGADEASAAAELRKRVRADFEWKLPALLRIERLSERDRAWREFEPNLVAPFGGASVTPPVADAAPNRPAANEDVTLTCMESAALSPERSLADATLTVGERQRATPPTPIPLPEVEARSGSARRRPVLVLAAIVLAALVVGLAVLQFGRADAPQAARFIVVQPSAPPSIAPANAAPSLGQEHAPRSPAAAVTEGVSSVPTPTPTPPSRASARRGPVAHFSDRFASRQGALEHCFDRFATSLEGAPRIVVQFDVSAAGKVRRAVLSPEPLNEVPLGQCLLEVARSTPFGALERDAKFSIPIQARARAKGR